MSDRSAAAAIDVDGSSVAAVPDRARDGVLLKAEPHSCFACGDLNEIGLQLQLYLVPGGCWTELSVPERFQGWEGVVHGGIISTILDEVMSWSLIERDLWGVTARMSVEFKKPLIVGQGIRAEAHIVEDRRRIVTAAGRIVDAQTGDELATSEGTFVTVNEAKKLQLQQRYGNLAEARRAAEREAAARRGR